MSAKEANMLDELRNKELRALTDSEYKTIRDEVESKGIRALRGSSAQIVFAALRKRNESMQKATGVRVGDMVSWDSSGGTARGKVEHIMREGVLGVPDSKFSIKAEKDDPAVLIRIYRNDEETDTLVGHKMSTLKKNSKVEKHGNHDQKSHGRWAKDDSEGEYADTEGLHPAHRWSKDDSEGEYADTEWQDIAAMDEMDLRNPPKSEAYYNARTGKTTVGKWILEEEKITNTYIQRGLSSSDARKQARADMESKYKTNINELARAHPEQIPELR